jgi:hypothetical protein
MFTREADHLPQQIGVGALFQKRAPRSTRSPGTEQMKAALSLPEIQFGRIDGADLSFAKNPIHASARSAPRLS